MEITRDVILDLLPLYVANEVSEDTKKLIEEYMETDPEVQKIALQTAMDELAGNIPNPLTEEDKLKAYRKTKWVNTLTIIGVAVFIVAVIGATLVFFLIPAP
jgi:hypothetical protein